MKIKWFGTATLIIEDNSHKILIDPFFSYTDKRELYRKKYLDQFKSCNAIVLTHGHFDHMHEVPEIVKDNPMPIYCTQTPRDTLIRKGVDENIINKVDAGDNFSVGDFEFIVHKGKHASFGFSLVFKTITQRSFWKNIKLAANIGRSAVFDEKESGETVIHQIKNNNKLILVMGSMGIDKNTEYPKDIDLFVLPYQGRSDLVKYSLFLFDKFKPKKVLLDHYDSYAPPISMKMDTSKLVQAAKDKGYDIDIMVGEREKTYTI